MFYLISIHFNGERKAEFDAPPALNLGEGQWIHARVIMRPGGGHSDVTVILMQCGGPPVTVVDRYPVPGFTPYVGRAHFAARSGGLSADHDIDNVRVQFLGLSQSALAFTTGCYSVVETAGQIELTVTRVGSVDAPITVNYATSDNTAIAGADYTAASGTLAFAAGETMKTLVVPVLDDSDNEGDQSFLVSLRSPTGAIDVVGGPVPAKVTIVDDEFCRPKGCWSQLLYTPTVPIHMHLLPNGKVMFWDRHDDARGWDGNPRLWDPATGTITTTAELTYDIFCAGHSFLADGSVLVTGRHIAMPPPFDGGVGDDEASIYHPFTNTWTRLPQMNAGRWYPSNVTLANGDVLVVGGTYLTSTTTVTSVVVNRLPQVFEAATNSWRDLSTALLGDNPAYPDYYPFLYVAPNGKTFDAGPQQVARYLDTSGTGAWTDVATSTLSYRDYGSSVMYDDGKVLIVGGNPRGDTFQPSASAEVIDLNQPTPAWRQVDPLSVGRRQLTTTLLPDGTVLATGGSSASGFDNPAGAVLYPELWDPATEQWTVMAEATRYRGYHSTALLLPDGRVLVGGGGHPDSAAGEQRNFEIFSPPYLFKGARPVIASAPTLLDYGQSFLMQTPDAERIAQVTLIRLGSVTHGFNQNQRIDRLDFMRVSGGLLVTPAADPNLSPPGHYMLFILDTNGLPSMAKIVRLGAPFKEYVPLARR